MAVEFRLAEERTVAVVGKRRVEMSWDLHVDPYGASPCVNGTARVNGNAYDVGGGWVSPDGSVEPYEGWEIDGGSGEFRKLVEAIYGPEFDEDQEHAVRGALATAIPGVLTPEEVLREMGRRIARSRGECETEAIYEFDGEYYYGIHNGGWWSEHDWRSEEGEWRCEGGELRDHPVQAFHVVAKSEVIARLLDWGHTPEEIEEMLEDTAQVESE